MDGSADKQIISGENCDNFGVSEILFLGAIELFQKVAINIEINSETNLTGQCFIEAILEYRQLLNPMDILQFSPTVIGRKVLKMKKRIRVEFECWHFVSPGLYRLSLLPNFISAPTEWVQMIAPNSALQIHLPAAAAIFPACQNDFSISWTLPTCERIRGESLDFRLRLLASVREETKQMEEMAYLEEFLLVEPNFDDKVFQKLFTGHQPNVTMDFIRIPCSKFDIIHEQFCFELISISKQYQQHQLWDRKCLRTEAITAQTNEHWEWSEWSKWTKCSCRRGEKNGTRKRMRLCGRSNEKPMDRTTIGSVRTPKANAFFGSGGCRGGHILQREQCEERSCANESTKMTSSFRAVSKLPSAKHRQNFLANSTVHCICGCQLSEQPQAMFFAALCPGKRMQKWTLKFGRPFKAQIILSAILEDDLLIFEVIRDNVEGKETIWSSNNPHDVSENVIIEGIFEKAAIFELKSTSDVAVDELFGLGMYRKQKKRRDFGVLVEYKFIGFEDTSTKNFFAEFLPIGGNISIVRKICYEEQYFTQCSLFLGICSLLLLLLAVFMPPIAFVCVAKRADANQNNLNALSVSTHCHKQIGSELGRSDGTDSTKLSSCMVISAKRRSPMIGTHQLIRNGVVVVEQRSIGIQLSHHSTPRCVSRQLRPQRRRSLSNWNGLQTSDRSTGSIESVTIGDNSNLVEDYWNEDDDFGAEQLQLGGKRAANDSDELVSDIDIDEIVRRETSSCCNRNSNVIKLVHQKDASTQF
uniref:Uncharacterized protein n=1 Tax=Globodera rostochiensis TaxID=31243 RepID=A0A914HZ50_GLORO